VANDSRCDVLIVEDEVIQCEEMAGFLARAGLKLVRAQRGGPTCACEIYS
jgi:response regulator RpfG family c-di-GMP phosphodiesterase